jgi:hypothetical protein
MACNPLIPLRSGGGFLGAGQAAGGGGDQPSNSPGSSEAS